MQGVPVEIGSALIGPILVSWGFGTISTLDGVPSRTENRTIGNITFYAARISRFEISRVVASRVCGRGRSESPSTAVGCLECRLNSVSTDGDGAARRWFRNHSTLGSAVTHG